MQRLSNLWRFGKVISNNQIATNLIKKNSFVPQFAAQMRPCSTSVHIFDIASVEDFSEKVINSPVPVIVDFHAEWCGPCQALGPRLEEKINGRDGQVLLAKINVDYAGELAMDYGISAVPTVFAFKNGEKISGFSGVLDDEQLDQFIDDAIEN